ncbi:MAG: hypothetical protein P5700_16405, partial [Arthrospira platensis PCC 7345]|nr:hypothetical protein [Limnospira sp. PMC 289.06]MDT9296606.1 hypothetical protein [Arthrospira platensis PCC 7345]
MQTTTITGVKVPKYVTPSVATWRRWEKLGAIKAVRTVGNQRRYIIEEAEKQKIRGRDKPHGLPLPFKTVLETFTSY